MRNALDSQISLLHGNDWYQHSSLFLEDQKDKIDNVLRRFDKEFDKKRAVTRPDVVSRLSFGFWADILYHEMYEDLWRKALHKAFPLRPKGTMRKHIGPKVENLRKLRNRIAHHEPIFSRPLLHDYDEILELGSWICVDTSKWIRLHNSFNSVFQRRPF